MFYRVSVMECASVWAKHVVNVLGFGIVHSKTDPDKRQVIPLYFLHLQMKPLICPGKWFFVYREQSVGEILIPGGGDAYVEK